MHIRDFALKGQKVTDVAGYDVVRYYKELESREAGVSEFYTTKDGREVPIRKTGILWRLATRIWERLMVLGCTAPGDTGIEEIFKELADTHEVK